MSTLKPTVHFNREKSYLCLDVEHDDLMRVRRALWKIGLTGGHFSPMNVNGQQYHYGMFLRRRDAEEAYAGVEDVQKVLDVINATLGSPVGNEQPRPAVAVAPRPEARSSTPSPVPATPDWDATIAAWERQLVGAMLQFPSRDKQHGLTIIDEQALLALIDNNNLRRARKEIDRWREAGMSPAAIARVTLRLHARQHAWDAALDHALAHHELLDDRISRVLTAQAWLQTGRADAARSTLALLEESRPLAVLQLFDARWLTLRAEATWLNGDAVAATYQLAQIIEDGARVADDELRAHWQQIRRTWTRALREDIESDRQLEERLARYDALLRIVPSEERADLERLRPQPVQETTQVDDPLAQIRSSLAEGNASDALRAIEHLPGATQTEHAVEIDLLRADALAASGREREALAVDRRLLEKHISELNEVPFHAVASRALLTAFHLQESATVLAIVAQIEQRGSTQPLPPEVERALALVRWTTGDREESRPALLRALHADPRDQLVADALLEEQAGLDPADLALALAPRVADHPEDAADAELLSNALLDTEQPREAFDVVQRYLVAVHGRIPTDDTCRLAVWGLELAREATRHGDMTRDILVDIARRVIQVHVLARRDSEVRDTLLDECLQEAIDPADRLMILMQCENARSDVRVKAAAYCADILQTQRQQRYPTLLRDVALLLDSLDPAMLRELVPLAEERARVEAASERLPLDEAIICVIGSTRAARARAFERLAADHGLKIHAQRQIEPFEGKFNLERMRAAVLRSTPRGQNAVDLVIHVPDCESHEVTVALREVASRVAHHDIEIPVRESAGAGSTSIIRAVEDYFRTRVSDEVSLRW